MTFVILIIQVSDIVTECTCIHISDHDVQLRTAKAFLVEIEKELLENSSVIGCHLSHINAHLHNALLACRAAKQTTHNIPSFSNRDFVAPGQKMEHQWRFSSTNKTPGRKRKANTLQYVVKCVCTLNIHYLNYTCMCVRHVHLHIYMYMCNGIISMSKKYLYVHLHVVCTQGMYSKHVHVHGISYYRHASPEKRKKLLNELDNIHVSSNQDNEVHVYTIM